MLFLGTEKFPKETTYKEFVGKSGGRCNAYTSPIETNYHFEVMWEHLEEGLDMYDLSYYLIDQIFSIFYFSIIH